MITVPGWAWADAAGTTGALPRFSYLCQGMTVLPGFTGGKMIVARVPHVPTVASLNVISVIIAGAAAASLQQSSRQPPRAAQGARPDVRGTPPMRANARRPAA
jgi:hypothetical protein